MFEKIPSIYFIPVPIQSTGIKVIQVIRHVRKNPFHPLHPCSKNSNTNRRSPEITLHLLEHVLPSFRQSRTMLRIDHPDRPMPERDLRAAGDLIDLHLDMIERGIRHEHRPGQLDEHRGFDHLHMPPQMLDALATVAKPSSARPLLKRHIHAHAVRPRPVHSHLEIAGNISPP